MDSQISFSVTHGRSVFGRTDHAHHHDRRGLDDCFEAIRGVAVAARRQGPRRPEVSRSPALFRVSQHHVAGSSGKVRALEQRLETVLAIEPAGTFEAFFDALAAMSRTAYLVQMFDSTVARAHVSAAGAKGGKMIKRSAVRARLLDENPSEGRSRRLAAGSDRRRSQ
jgi:hypothetical protein